MDMQQPNPMMGQDPAMGAEDASGSYEICIRVGPTGELSVGKEGGEMAEADGMQPPEAAYQPAADIKEALKLVVGIYQSNGQAQAGPGAEQSAAESAFQMSRGGGR